MELGVVTADGNGVIRTVNQHACKMFGYAKEDLIDKKINVLMPSPYAEQHDAYLQRYERTKKARLLGTCRVVDGRRSSGEVFSLRLSLSKIESEEEGIIWVSLFEPIKQNQIVLTLDPDGEKIMDCTGHPELLGHTAATLKGASIRTLIPKGLHHPTCSSKKPLDNSHSPKEQFPFGRSRNFLAQNKNGKDSVWVSVVIKERTLLTAKGSSETPPEQPSSSHLKTGGCPFHVEKHTVHYPGEVKESCVGGDRSLLMAVLTPIEKDVEGMATIDERGIVRSCNSSFLTLFGYSQEEMIGRSIGSLMSEMALPVLRAIAGEKNLTDAQRRIIGKGFHAALGLHRDLTVFPMKFCVDELFPTPPTTHHAPDSSGDAMEIEHSISSAPVLYQCTIQRLRADEEQDLKEMLAETYEDLLETGAAHPHRVSTTDLPGAIKKEPLEQKSAKKEKKKKDVPIGDSPTTRRVQQGAYAGAYTYDVTLGGGYFGKVKMAIHRLTGEKVAIKTLRKRQYENIKMAYPPRELKLMMSLNHPNIYKLLEVVEMDDRILMITEFCSGGEVFDYMAKQDHFDDKESRRLFRQLVSAVDYMHLNGVCHRDLKLENLLLDENKNIKIIDLGLGNFFDRQRLLDSFCGTADYASPELWQGKRYVGPEVDIWSMGVLLFVFLTGKMPFLSPRHAVAGDFFFPSFPPVSESAKALIRRMLVANSSLRADMEEVRNHPWVKAADGTPPPRYFAKRLADLDRDIIKQMVELLGFEEQSIISSLSHNDFNQFTTTYQLLLNKKSRLQAAAQRPKEAQTHKKAQSQPQQQQPTQQAHHEGLCTIS